MLFHDDCGHPAFIFCFTGIELEHIKISGRTVLLGSRIGKMIPTSIAGMRNVG